MARTVEQAFDHFLSKLTPSATETERARSHRLSIEATLKASHCMTHFFRSGSFGYGTSVRGHSDVDYFAVLPGSHFQKNSKVVLTQTRLALKRRFAQTPVSIESPAIILPFGTHAGERHEIVPAFELKAVNNFRVFAIPDRGTGWMVSSPDAHAAYVDYADGQREDRVKPLVRLMKAWKYVSKAPIRSFYLELATSIYALGQSSIMYEYDVALLLMKLQEVALGPLGDPMQIEGSVSAGTSGEINVALARARRTRLWTERALAYAQNGKVAAALMCWKRVFGSSFPGYS